MDAVHPFWSAATLMMYNYSVNETSTSSAKQLGPYYTTEKHFGKDTIMKYIWMHERLVEGTTNMSS